MSPEDERDVYRSTVEACAVSFEKLSAQALEKAKLLREVLDDPENNSEYVWEDEGGSTRA